MQIFHSDSVLQTEQIAADFANTLKPGDFLAFRGDMGAGKTAFVRGLCQGLSLPDEVSSPTFALMHEYKNKDITLCHFDMYRIMDEDDLYSIGFFDYLETDAILAVEWSERILDFLPDNALIVDITAPAPEERIIRIYPLSEEEA